MAHSQTRNAEDFAANTKGGKASRSRKPLATDEAQRGKGKGRAGRNKDIPEDQARLIGANDGDFKVGK